MSLCDSTRDYTPERDNISKTVKLIQGNIKIEESKVEVIETTQRRTRKDMNCAKDRYKTNSKVRECKPKKNVNFLEIYQKLTKFRSNQ